MTDFFAKKTQHVQLFGNPLLGTPPILDSQYRGTITQNWEKRVSESKNTNIPGPPNFRKAHFEPKRSHCPCGALYRNGDFVTRDVLFFVVEEIGFFDCETPLSQFCVFDSCAGQSDLQGKV